MLHLLEWKSVTKDYKNLNVKIFYREYSNKIVF